MMCSTFAQSAPAAEAASGQFVPTKVDPEPVPRQATPAPMLPPSADLDGLVFWIGPTGAASRVDGVWDTTIGGDLSVIEVRENALLGAIGGTLGASRWTERGGGRLWLDAIAGTRLVRMIGLSAGPILEMNELAHPRVGGSVGLWAFVGVTPFVRVGMVQDLGGFVDIGVHLSLPVIRHRH